MIIVFVLFMLFVGVAFAAVMVALFDGSKLQPSYREILIRRCEEQHAAIMRGDERLGVYGKYPPADL